MVLNIERPSGRCWDASRCSEPSGGNFCIPFAVLIARALAGWPLKFLLIAATSLLTFGKWDYFFYLGPFHTGSALGEERGGCGYRVKPLPRAWLDAGEDKTPRQHQESDGDQTSRRAGSWLGRENINITGFPSGEVFDSRMVEFGKLQARRLPLHPLALGLGHLPPVTWGISSCLPLSQLGEKSDF